MIRITLTEQEEKDLPLRARTLSGRVCQRIVYVQLAHHGFSAPTIGTMLSCSEDTVREWLKRYQEKGVDGLHDRPRSGRPPKEPYLKAIVEAQMAQGPECFGYCATCWTVLLLAGHLARRFKIWVSTSTVQRAVRDIGYRWSRPRLAPARKSDPEKEAKLLRVLSYLRNRAQDVHLLFADESDLHLLPVLRAMWMRGKQRRIPTPGNNHKIHCFGALDIATGLWQHLIRSTKRSTDFVALLERVLLAYPTGIIILIVDNASIHTSKLTRKWLAQHPRLNLVFLPKYIGAQLNPVEKIWWLLKNRVAANRCAKDLGQLANKAEHFFDDLTPGDALRLVAADKLTEHFAAEALAA